MKDTLKGSWVREQGLVFAYCLLVALGCLLICSKSSPLYPINDWTDANIYFSMGKGMANGRMLYRDIYDHKGPLLYALHALCYLVSPLSFLGVWLMEVLAGAFFLFAARKICTLYGAKKSTLLALPALAMLVFASLSFQQGDSAEELCLPLLAISLYAWLKHTRERSSMSPKTLMLHGVLCGCVLWIKFTLLGFYAAWIVLAFGSLAAGGQWRKAWQALGWFAAGVAIATLPWVVYFGLHGALLPWLKTYLYDNLFLYSGGGDGAGLLARGKAMAKSAWDWFGQNLLYTLPLALGMVWATARPQGTREEKRSLWLLLGASALGVFVGGKSYLYYGLILAVFAVMGMAAVCSFLEGRVAKAGKGFVATLMAAMCLGSVGGCYGLSPNVSTSFLMPRESAMQYQLAAIVTETPGATLLNYGFMDAGFYTATGITPNVKYFHQTNVPLQEMLDEQVRYISEGVCDYVVTRGKQPESIADKYDLVAEADAPEGFWYERVYLYRLKGLGEGR